MDRQNEVQEPLSDVAFRTRCALEEAMAVMDSFDTMFPSRDQISPGASVSKAEHRPGLAELVGQNDTLAKLVRERVSVLTARIGRL